MMSSAQHAFLKATFPVHFSFIESIFTRPLFRFQLVSRILITLALTRIQKGTRHFFTAHPSCSDPRPRCRHAYSWRPSGLRMPNPYGVITSAFGQKRVSVWCVGQAYFEKLVFWGPCLPPPLRLVHPCLPGVSSSDQRPV